MSKREKTSTMSSFDDLLQCSVCLERFTNPKVLPCQHTFCLSCLKGIIKDDRSVNCPTCRRTHRLPQDGVAELPDNLVVKNLLDMVDETTPCFDCGKKQILGDCEHCKQEVCADCRVAHNRLETEISMLIQLLNTGLRCKTDVEVKEFARKSIEVINEAETSIRASYDEALKTLTEKRDEVLNEAQILTKFPKAIVEDKQGSWFEEIRTDLSFCHLTESLEGMKKSLSRVEEMMNGKLDLTECTPFGEITLDGREILKISEAGVKSLTSTSDDPDADEAKSLDDGVSVPSNVDYESRQSLWKLVISTPAGGCDEFNPTCAIYSLPEDAMYCLSNGKLLRYDAKTGVGKIACGIFEAKHMALADSGSLILIDEKNMVRINADRLEKPKHDGFNFDLTNLPAGTKATQVSCHEKEVMILDCGERRFLRFDESGDLLGEIRVEGRLFDFSKSSRMWVGQNGLIYVSDMLLDTEESAAVWNSCLNEPKSVIASWSGSNIMIINSDGEEYDRFDIDDNEGSKEYQFATYVENGTCELNHIRHTRIDRNSIPDFGDIISDITEGRGPVSGLCVDNDGYVLLTRPGKNQIDVYDSDGDHYCSMGNPENSELKDPTGLSLMPDGRLVVCDTGNNRILIF